MAKKKVCDATDATTTWEPDDELQRLREVDLERKLDDDILYIQSQDTVRYRNVFLSIIREEAPQVLVSLARMIGSSDSKEPSEILASEVETCGSVEPEKRESSARRHLISNLELDVYGRWAESFGLYHHESSAGRWIVTAAERTVDYWKKNPNALNTDWSPDAAEMDDWDTHTLLPLSDSAKAKLTLDHTFELTFRSWCPQKESESSYRESVNKELANMLNDYVSTTKRKLGYRVEKNAPVKRESSQHHFLWLVQYQVKRMSLNAIKKEHLEKRNEEKAPSQILEEVYQTAKLLFGEPWKAWLRKPLKGGRKRKASTSPRRKSSEKEQD